MTSFTFSVVFFLHFCRFVSFIMSQKEPTWFKWRKKTKIENKSAPALFLNHLYSFSSLACSMWPVFSFGSFCVGKGMLVSHFRVQLFLHLVWKNIFPAIQADECRCRRRRAVKRKLIEINYSLIVTISIYTTKEFNVTALGYPATHIAHKS